MAKCNQLTPLPFKGLNTLPADDARCLATYRLLVALLLASHPSHLVADVAMVIPLSI